MFWCALRIALFGFYAFPSRATHSRHWTGLGYFADLVSFLLPSRSVKPSTLGAFIHGGAHRFGSGGKRTREGYYFAIEHDGDGLCHDIEQNLRP